MVTADEAGLIARGIGSAVAAGGTLTAVQISLLTEVTDAVLGVRVDFETLEPLGPEALAGVLAEQPETFRRRVVHQMVLGALILRPIPPEVARRVAAYADALGISDQFVRIARRYAQGAFGLAWLDLHRSGFAEHWENARSDEGCGTCTAAVVSVYQARLAVHRHTWPSTTSSTCSPTMART